MPTAIPVLPLDGSVFGMAKDKVTITLDRAKAADARVLVGAASTSEVIDIALDRLIRAERKAKDVAAYRGTPPTEADVDLARTADFESLADETDWESLYSGAPI